MGLLPVPEKLPFVFCLLLVSLVLSRLLLAQRHSRSHTVGQALSWPFSNELVSLPVNTLVLGNLRSIVGICQTPVIANAGERSGGVHEWGV